jgi:hypothetical protein
MTPAWTLAAAVLVAAGSTPTVSVRGLARHHHRYCAGGGAAVTDEDLRRVLPPRPLAGVELAASPGTEIPPGEPAARAKTDADGRFELRLRPGTWCLYLASRALPPRIERGPPATEPTPTAPVVDSVDQKCLEAERRQCNEVVEVGKDGVAVELGTWERCSEPFNQPCWVGPQPP